jgi:8-oxo-dGTP pyrophosphatase MutT (NUDIX family)
LHTAIVDKEAQCVSISAAHKDNPFNNNLDGGDNVETQTLPLPDPWAQNFLVLLVLLIYPDEPTDDWDDVRILLVRDYDKSPHGEEPYWKFIGGSAEYLPSLGRMETGEEAIVRETLQEAGIKLDVTDVKPLGETRESSAKGPGLYSIKFYVSRVSESMIAEQVQKQGIHRYAENGTYYYESSILEVSMPYLGKVASLGFRFLWKHKKWLKRANKTILNMLFKALH